MIGRRQFMHLSAGAAALMAMPRVATAQAYPSRPVRIVVPVTAGGAQDILARLMGQSLSERLGQPVVIENRPGGGGNIGSEAVARAAADGHTLLLVASAHAINATLHQRPNFHFIHDIAPIAGISRGPHAMVVHPAVPAETVPAFIAYARANPGKISMASAGIGNGTHLVGELFKMMAGIDMVHVPYRGGGPALTDLLGRQVDVMFPTTAACIEYVRDGRLRALAVTTATRSPALPDIPVIGDSLPGYEASFWFGLGAPRNTPPEIIDRINREINAALADPAIKARLAGLGGEALALSPASFASLIAHETEKWAKVIRFADIKPQ